jgi:hypothetical protein
MEYRRTDHQRQHRSLVVSINGVTIRAGYDLWTYFTPLPPTTDRFQRWRIDPSYKHRAVHIYPRFHVGVSINF